MVKTNPVFLLLILGMLLPICLIGQQSPVHILKQIVFNSSDTVYFDSVPVLTSNITVTDTLGQPIPENQYIISATPAYIIRTNKSLKHLIISYQRMAPAVFSKYANKDKSLIQPRNMAFINPFSYQPGSKNNDIVDKDGLDMRGSISRGLGFGNSQNLVVNSNLNLQINGKLNNDIDISAAVSDDNNPIQPEGNTQQLQDFDRVYIKLSKNKTAVTMGDFEMLKPVDNYFMKYNKKSRGIQVSTYNKLSKDWQLSSAGEGAVSRGRFARNIINIIEGNQGPYRLTGSNNEQFIILIAGTEVIYIDGVKMERGEQNDYTIDYNTGEITFMPKRLITRYSRVVAEFQYADRNYARSVFTTAQTFQWRKSLTIQMNYFTEQDHKNQPFQRILSDTDKYILSQIGDATNLAIINTESSAKSFDKSQLLYTKKDTTLNGTAYQIYVFAQEKGSDSNYYLVTFNNVGVGNGDYKIAQSAANGRVFEWIPPINGLHRGSYDPLVRLITPKRLQMFTLGSSYKIDTFTTIDLTAVGTIYDKNTFSGKDKANDLGWGLKAAIKQNYKKLKYHKKLLYAYQMQYEQVDQNFRYIERYRPVEFDRIWNRNLQNTDRKDSGFAEKIGNAQFSLTHSNLFKVNYQTSYYHRSLRLNGLQHQADAFTKIKHTSIQASAEKLDANSLNASTTINKIRHYKLGLTQEMKMAVLKAQYEAEQVDNLLSETDSLLAGSYRFQSSTFSLTNTDTAKIIYGIEYNRRLDILPFNNQYIRASAGDNYTFKIEYDQETSKRIHFNTTYRIFDADSSHFSLKPEKTLIMRLEADWSFFNKLITSSTYYQAGTGQELRRQYSYIEVQPGNGIYQWNDYNGNQVQELNEFEVAIFKDKARYIKIFQPTTEYIQTNALQFNQSIIVNPAATKIASAFLKKCYVLTTFKIDRKLFYNDNKEQLYNPLYNKLLDTTLVSLNSFSRTSFFYNRNNPVWGADYTFIDNRSKQLLTNGVDGRSKADHAINLRWNTKSEFSFNLALNAGNKSFLSQYFDNRNFWFDYTIVHPKLNWQWKNFFRVSFYFDYYKAVNRSKYGSEKTLNRESGFEIKYNFKENGSIFSKFSFNEVNYQGTESSPIAFDMLNGLQNGRNLLWNINWQQRISKNIQVTAVYDGRKNETANAVHIARVEARYIF